MIKALRQLVGGAPAGNHPATGQERHHLMVAVAVLLHEARRSDYAEARGEADAAVSALMDLFGLPGADAQKLLEEGRERAQQLTSFYAPVSTIKRDFALEERIRLIEHLWRIAFADGRLNLYEDHYVRKIAHLLYVPNTQSMLARNRARG